MWFHSAVVDARRIVQERHRQLIALLGVCAALLLAAVAVVVVRDDSEPYVAPPTTTTIPPTTTSTKPPPVVPVSTDLASPNGEIPAYDAPGGNQIDTVGQWYGYPMTMPVVEERGPWLRIMMPERPNELTAWVRAE